LIAFGQSLGTTRNCTWTFLGMKSILTRFAQPHIQLYMFCPYVISTLYHLLEELQMRAFKRYFSHAILLTTLHLPKRNELWYHCCLSQLYFIGH
jgi:hypothetical protein